jgi:hypothetical protein
MLRAEVDLSVICSAFVIRTYSPYASSIPQDALTVRFSSAL